MLPKTHHRTDGHIVRVEQNFWAKVRKTSSCWEWTACKHDFGYGVFRCKRVLPKLEEIERGVLYGCVRLELLLPPNGLLDAMYKWKFPGCVGYTLTDAVRLPPRPLKGSLGIFWVDLTEEEQHALGSARLL